FSRRLGDFLRAQTEKRWAHDYGYEADELTGRTLLIIGAGSIGSEIARKAKAFDMTVYGIKNDPVPLEHFDRVAGTDALHGFLAESDYNVVITPLTARTYRMIGEKEFKAMKNSSIFINVSRGDTVDEAAMIEALRRGEIAGAGLDVFRDEPLPVSSPLWDMKNVFITPHMAGMSPHYMERAMEVFCDEFVAYRGGEKLRNVIGLDRGY
ncbi:MAG: D-2-hydroxyacid dehydrogenase, partial [Deltaproteobacteria bacterium]|nr:D-2-hydroxyacid dehydrogenase [Deltaproteobacteria bacterium]